MFYFFLHENRIKVPLIEATTANNLKLIAEVKKSFAAQFRFTVFPLHLSLPINFCLIFSASSHKPEHFEIN
jgi:hypothetical protein